MAGTIREPLALPVRVLVKGASTVNWVSFRNGPRSDFAYPRATEAALLSLGRPAVVRDTSMAAEHPKAALRAWSREVVTWSPDVIVLHYGHMECMHLLLPRVLQQYAQSLEYRPGPVRDFYRDRLLRPFWHALARIQQRVARLVPSRLFDLRARRAVRDMHRYIERTQRVASPLVLVMEMTPPGENYATWFPGMEQRLEAMNVHLRGLVEGVGLPHVRFFPTQAALADLVSTGAPINPDGGHFTPAAHRAIATRLATVIASWIDEEGHLGPPAEGPVTGGATGHVRSGGTDPAAQAPTGPLPRRG